MNHSRESKRVRVGKETKKRRRKKVCSTAYLGIEEEEESEIVSDFSFEGGSLFRSATSQVIKIKIGI